MLTISALSIMMVPISIIPVLIAPIQTCVDAEGQCESQTEQKKTRHYLTSSCASFKV